jgi:NO-binding membrane sensor protein with MHYT domain
VVTVHNFSNGLLNPALGYAMSCVGALLGLRCVVLARAYKGWARARWLALASVSIGAVGIWAMHFIAMLGFSIPGEPLRYNVPITIASMLLAVVVVAVGLFIVGFTNAGFGDGGWPRLVAGGVIIGVGVAGMHYLGMAAMSMPGGMSYQLPLVIVSVLIAVGAGTAALWIGTWVRGVGATIVAALIFGVAVTGMHYTGMAALKITGTAMSMQSMAGSVSGATAASFLIPLLAVISLATFLLTLAISVAPNEDEIRTDAEIRQRLEYLEHRDPAADPGFAPGPAGDPRFAQGPPANPRFAQSQSFRRNTQ